MGSIMSCSDNCKLKQSPKCQFWKCNKTTKPGLGIKPKSKKCGAKRH